MKRRTFIKNISVLGLIAVATTSLLSKEDKKNEYQNTGLFIFIDADHEYSSVKKDIQAWVGKLKPNGLLCGMTYI